jgi:hypothetical protein
MHLLQDILIWACSSNALEDPTKIILRDRSHRPPKEGCLENVALDLVAEGISTSLSQTP